TGWTPEPFVVSDVDLERLMREYGVAQADAPAVKVSRVVGIRDASRRIAATAELERSVKVTEAHMDPFTWIRVARQASINSLLVVDEDGDGEEGRTWRAATTSR